MWSLDDHVREFQYNHCTAPPWQPRQDNMGKIGISYPGYNIGHPYPTWKKRGICKYMYMWFIPNSSFQFSLTDLNTCCLYLQNRWLNPWNIGWKIPESTRYWHKYTLNVLIWENYLCTNHFAFISDVQAYFWLWTIYSYDQKISQQFSR